MKKINRYAKTYMKQVLAIILSSIIFAASVSAVSFNSMETFIKYQISNSLYAVSVSLYSVYQDYGINDHSIEYLDTLMRGYKENLNVDSSIILKDREILSTSIGHYINEDDDVVKSLKEDGISIKGDANINGNGYYNCTIALYDEDENYIGTIFVGKEVDLIATSLRGRQMIFIAFIWVLCIIYILYVGLSATRRYNRYLEISKLHKKETD